MLGIGPPVLLDIESPDLLTAEERRLFAERLAEVEFTPPRIELRRWPPHFRR
jgi:hypothetical protein